jgi:uncharacterized protein YqhQ
MKSSGIGGQAVMEGVMMKNGDKYAVAVRKPDGEIVVDIKEHKLPGWVVTLKKIPIIRGVVSFVDSLYIGVSTLTYSASFYEEEEEKQERTEQQIARDEKKEGLMMGFTVVLSVILALGLFMALPYGLSLLFEKVITSQLVLSLLEGLIRMAIFLLYVVAISKMEDIRRVYMYHGAEHKCINCIEHGLDLTVDNVRKSSKQHKRCGTSFLLIVMVFTIVFFMFIQASTPLARLGLRLLLVPVIAGVAFEFIRLAGSSDSRIVNALSKPGMWLQNLTTKEPDDSMIEVGMASVEAVFDWKEFIAEEKP